MSTGIVVFAHGSRVGSANEAVRAITETAAEAGGFEHVEAAFLEPIRPTLSEAVDRLVRAGVSRIVVIPYFLTLGLHLQRDLPRIVEQLKRVHPGVEIHVSPPLDGHPALAGIVLDRAREALAQWYQGSSKPG